MIPRSVQQKTIESVRYRIPQDSEVDVVVDRHLSQLGEMAKTSPKRTGSDPVDRFAAQGLSDDARPVRVVESLVWPPINGIGEFFTQLPSDHELSQRMTGYNYIETYKLIYEILNLSDGKRTWHDVQRLVAGQFQETSHAEVSNLARLLLDAGAIEQIEGEDR